MNRRLLANRMAIGLASDVFGLVAVESDRVLQASTPSHNGKIQRTVGPKSDCSIWLNHTNNPNPNAIE